MASLIHFEGPADTAEGNQPGLLAPGTYPLQVASAGTAGSVRQGSAVVTRSGSGLINHFDVVSDTLEMTLVRQADGSVRVTGLYVAGIDFPPTSSSGDLWRPAPDLLGAMPATVGWGWSRNASNGGDIRLTQFSTTRGVRTTLDSIGLPIRTQRVNTTLTFSGGMTGTVKIAHIEVVGNPKRMVESWHGSVTTGGDKTSVQMLMSMGGLGNFGG